uniref:Uncharacterized protein n=1 Tax=Odontella aurita TaxID=265563 RepID=A0A7S4JFN5_9STRA|mmetsp:Transcript_45722/g.138935  ORF Transcript_45722/g.138935 Transcript_45722/m.138935 type:complete len:133 (+) Transcript_45722:185-583(+)|eukprot:CAMPEP_0113568978 /NCGR_PEP_ID=MMETSP0015_2-20120614/24149_1 /TAXON_ID=2838 /ORGANISM="Odontella" /LENGTH=132 /DNA_ID=CAMNT_0000471579 /DNA_START=140 /DNA_END=538 /DNA_ORIENTATION=- /assembly_acc=CAM_ASM_000160
MMKLLSLFAVCGLAAAFSPGPVAFRTHQRAKALSATSKCETFERAVECAENFGYCNLDELENLAGELEAFQGSFFEHGEEVMEQKEVGDRKDVAEVLKMQSELRLRMDYLENANVFADDVHNEVDAYPDQAW